MPTRPDPVDPLVIRKQRLLRIFYLAFVGCAISFVAAQYFRSPWRYGLLFVSLALTVLAVWILVRFLRVIDEFEALYLYDALRFAFVGILSLLTIEAFLETFGLPRVPAYGNAVCAVILYSLGLVYSSWQHHWRRGYE